MTTAHRPTFDPAKGKEAQRVKEWLKSFGEVASFDDTGSTEGGGNAPFAVTFKQRHSGESAVRALLQPDYQVPDVGKVKLVWAPAPPAATASPGSASPAVSATNGSAGNASAPAASGQAIEGDDDDNWKR